MQIDQLNIIAQTIFDKKGANIIALDVRGISSLCDYMIVAEGSIDKHNQSIAHGIIECVKEKLKEKPCHVEGMTDGGWIVIDYLDIIVHIFIPELREKYELEKLFEDAKIVDLQIEVGQEKKH